MTSDRKVYKLLTPFANVEGEGGLSFISGQMYAVSYLKDVATIPKIGKLFAFSTRELAQFFAKEQLGPCLCELWVADATGVETPPVSYIPRSSEHFRDFWKNIPMTLSCPRILVQTYIIPSGTLWCETITIRERIVTYNGV